jgi:hypothetical protein
LSEAYHPHVISTRWKGKKEFMWWSCFTWYEKGPYYIWEEETAEEKKAAKKDLAERNKVAWQDSYIKWLSEGPLGFRLRISNTQIGGVQPRFRHTKATGAFVRKDGAGGIDWYRYQTKIIKRKLIPFYNRLMRRYGFAVVVEDNAGSHPSHYNVQLWELLEIARMEWPSVWTMISSMPEAHNI